MSAVVESTIRPSATPLLILKVATVGEISLFDVVGLVAEYV